MSDYPDIDFLHIDGDLFIYRCANACAEEPVFIACSTMDKMLGSILMAFPEVGYQVYLSGASSENYRHQYAITAPYKGNRKQEKPKHYDALRQYLMDDWGATMSHGNEADDTISIDYTTRWKAHCKNPESTSVPCVVSVDKDFDQLTGLRYDFVKEELVWKTQHEANLNLYRQVMEGDTADNVKGIFGVGKVKAAKFLAECNTPKEMYDVCVEKFIELADCTADEAHLRVEENLNLVFLQRVEGEYFRSPDGSKETKSTEDESREDVDGSKVLGVPA